MKTCDIQQARRLRPLPEKCFIIALQIKGVMRAISRGFHARHASEDCERLANTF
jgi:hypothetical protein